MDFSSSRYTLSSPYHNLPNNNLRYTLRIYRVRPHLLRVHRLDHAAHHVLSRLPVRPLILSEERLVVDRMLLGFKPCSAIPTSCKGRDGVQGLQWSLNAAG